MDVLVVALVSDEQVMEELQPAVGFRWFALM
jgi:hypothetical protein